MDKELIAGIFRGIIGEQNVKIDEPMKSHTSFKLGGHTDILVLPPNTEMLGQVIKVCESEKIPVYIMGNGSNLIVRDKGIRGVVIKLFEQFDGWSVSGDMIEAQAGVLLSKLSKIALEHSLSGLEFAEGIPGTVGGAVYMNAGAYGGQMKDVVVTSEYMDKHGNIRCLHGEEHKFDYRKSIIQELGGIVLKTQIKLVKGDYYKIKETMDDYNNRRKEKQPLELPSAGSVFKRPEGYFAGQLIQECGLRGYRIGGAEVSSKHCGFIVNTGGATSEDVINLISHIKSCVKSKFGLDLETEVKIVGEE